MTTHSNEYMKRWRDEHHEQYLEYQRNYRHTHAREFVAYTQKYRTTHPETYKESMKKTGARRIIKLRQAALDHYGHKCVCCGESIERFLTIDHINGAGKEIRKQQGWGQGFYQWLKNNNYPEGYQTLCFNCNCGRALNSGICPHKIAR